IPCFEGAGVVVETGREAGHVSIGAHVILPHNLGTRREACAVKAIALVVVPSKIDLVRAAMLKINPLTAWRLLHDYVEMKRQDWVIQDAGNSAAGGGVCEIARVCRSG